MTEQTEKTGSDLFTHVMQLMLRTGQEVFWSEFLKLTKPNGFLFPCLGTWLEVDGSPIRRRYKLAVR